MRLGYVARALLVWSAWISPGLAASPSPRAAPVPSAKAGAGGEAGAEGVSARVDGAEDVATAGGKEAPGGDAPAIDHLAEERTRKAKAKRKRERARKRARKQRLAERRQRRQSQARGQRKQVTLPKRPPAPRHEPPLPEIVDHESALERQRFAQWGWRADKDGQVRVPLADYRSWQRIRLWNVDHLTAFRYTKQHHAITVVFAVESESARTSRSCMEEFEREGLLTLRRRKVHIEPIATVDRTWRDQEIVVHRTEGFTHFLFSRYEFSAAWAAYPVYDGGCLIYSTVVLWEGRPDLARAVVDRWVVEGVEQITPLTRQIPYRH